MNRRAKMVQKLGSVQFAMWELHLYLDTHPMDSAAQMRLCGYQKTYAALRAEFEAAYGPLSPAAGSGTAWLADPWPWEKQEECVK